ncbi:hypothetical protein [Priestia aryabhattai]|uniref:hypothetical protein n=1 Tax=Priestia aryabhattai TaxID=412384 RepID=UPI003CBC27F7
MKTLTNKEDVKVAAMNEVKRFIQQNNIDMSTYICEDGTLDIKAFMQEHGYKVL